MNSIGNTKQHVLYALAAAAALLALAGGIALDTAPGSSSDQRDAAASVLKERRLDPARTGGADRPAAVAAVRHRERMRLAMRLAPIAAISESAETEVDDGDGAVVPGADTIADIAPVFRGWPPAERLETIRWMAAAPGGKIVSLFPDLQRADALPESERLAIANDRVDAIIGLLALDGYQVAESGDPIAPARLVSSADDPDSGDLLYDPSEPELSLLPDDARGGGSAS
ncbi:MAG: hypothetical protein HYV63_19520 [Candidatus Schekmanbacteria bacterium]|nr:hypothetical protein [Candidatus Schekmanbacteria bacterium]